MEFVTYTVCMSRESILILLGILTILAPFSGLPISWLESILPVIGLAVAALGFSMRRRAPSSDALRSEEPTGVDFSVL